MKIIFVINKLSGGGAERVLSILANAFSENHDVTIVTLFSSEIGYSVSSNIEVINLVSSYKISLVRFSKKVLKLRKIIKQKEITHVISFLYDVNIYTILATAFIKKTRVIVSERNDPLNEPKSRLLRHIRNILYNFADYLVFQTKEAQQCFNKRIIAKSCIISNPINPNIESLNLKKKKRIIGIGRLEEQKDFSTLIYAFHKFHALHPEYSLNIFGMGPLKKELEDLIRNLNIHDSAKIIGYTNHIYQEIQSSEIFVLSSRFEGISNALLECMSLGIPSIATDCPIYGTRAIINNGENGFLFPVGDIDRLTELLLTITEDKLLYNSISNEAKKIKHKNSISAIYKQWELILSKENFV